MNGKRLRVKDLPETERPYEKCLQYGANSLTDAELIAVLIRTGSKNERAAEVAQRVLAKGIVPQGILNLHYLSINEMMEIDGIGQVKAIQLKCMAEISKRMAKETRREGLVFNRPDAVASYYMEEMRHLDKEKLMIVYLDGKSKKIREVIISKGTINASPASPREIFRSALQNDATCIILMHNHPSGDPTPSREDLLVSSRLKEVGDIAQAH